MLSLQSSTGNRFVFEPGDLINQGGEGAIYGVRGAAELVAKIYHPLKRDPKISAAMERAKAASVTEARLAKLRAMLANPPPDNGNRGHVAIAWPTDLLFDPGPAGAFRGFLMKRVPKSRQLAAFTVPSSRTPDLRHLGYHHAHIAASNVALVFDALHRAGYVVGDVSGGNVLAAGNGMVSIVDTDSFQVWDPAAKRMFRCSVGTADFTSPELQGANFREIDRRAEHDLFGLAVLLFQLLMSGEHPFDGSTSDETYGSWDRSERIKRRANFPFGPVQLPFRRRPAAPPLTCLDPELQKLFLVCFTDGMHDPKRRPDAKTWQIALVRATARLKECSTNRVHAYFNGLSSCPYCEVEQEVLKRARAKSQKQATTKFTLPSPGLFGSQFLSSRPLFTPSPPPPPPPPPRPLIGAGSWRFLAAGPDPRAPLAAAVAPITVNLLPDGTLVGSLDLNMGMLGASDMNMSMSMDGNWHHDATSQTFTWHYVIRAKPMNFLGMQLPINVPPQQVSQSMRVAAQPDGSLAATDGSGGQFRIIRL